MATLSPPAALTGLAAFRAALPPGTGAAPTADRLCDIATVMALPRGEQLAPDPREDRLVFLAAGSAKLVARSSPAGAGASPSVNQVLAFHFAGDMISVLHQGTRVTWGDVRLIGLTDCDLVTFPADAFLDAAQGDPAVLRAVLIRSLQALHGSRTRMMQLGHKSARQRLADFLVSMAERLADCDPDCHADGTAGPCRFVLPMSRRDIGDSLGLTIETVSRQFTDLREAGLIATQGRSRIMLTDLPALARLAGRGGPGETAAPAKTSQI